jgi:hypothetical protein
VRETKNEKTLGGILFEKVKIEKDVILDELNGYLKSQGKVAE